MFAAAAERHVAMHQKVLDLGDGRPYNWFVRCNKAARRTGRQDDPGRRHLFGADALRCGTWMCRLNPPPRQDGKVTMYNATEQIAEFNKVERRLRDQARLDLDREGREARVAEPERRQARARAGRRRRASRRLGQGRAGADGAARQDRRARRAERHGLLAHAVRAVDRSVSRNSRRSPKQAWSSYTKNVAAVRREGQRRRARRLGLRASTRSSSTIAASTAAFDQFQKATKQVVSLADASVRAAATNGTTKGRKAA